MNLINNNSITIDGDKEFLFLDFNQKLSAGNVSRVV